MLPPEAVAQVPGRDRPPHGPREIDAEHPQVVE